ncbi:MAG: alpha-L-fucosidase [Actinobacteria bacterium]|uniref:alpha-L-fucosidase n=1 Tax=freshwater metagenome TaxID=449393 RepID=A0A6J6Y0P9_9ZZZZ|nr:alpha-L-fucosidase [Actinomycetota bacterium]
MSEAGFPFADRPIPDWYEDAKFGIFIHWGPYTVPCYAPVENNMGDLMAGDNWTEAFRSSPYTEWYLNSWALEGSATAKHHAEVYGDRTYQSFVEEFRERSNGVDVADWSDLFQAAGARYVVPVTKHHDGFLMWQSDHANPNRTDWMATRDHVGELADAVRERGMRFGVYYSGGLDWTFSEPGFDSVMGMIQNIPVTPEYCDYATAHVHELIERYNPSLLWNDIAWPMTLDPNDVFSYYYDRVPDGIVNDRWNIIAVRSGQLHADIATPEYSTKASDDRKWEVCRGVGRSFAYNRMETEATMPSVDELIWMLVDIVARGGNLLLNVGPTADGQIPMAQAARLVALGWWLRVNGDAIYGTRTWRIQTGVTDDGREIRYTMNGDTVYACVEGGPSGELRLADVSVGAGSVVTMLGNSRALPHRVDGNDLVITLVDHLPASPATVFAITGAI